MNTLKALIIEDEAHAQANLTKQINSNFDNIEIIGTISSVRGAVEWFNCEDNHADIIFMDVELSDGRCFDIFDLTQVKGSVIITTAFDNYAIKAFKINSVDYLLKPIETEELSKAITRCQERIKEDSTSIDIESIRKALGMTTSAYKQRFVVRIGDRITVVNTHDIAYFYAEDKSTYLITNEKRRYIIDNSLDAVIEQIDANRFFRLSRNCIASIESIGTISKHFNSRLKITLKPESEFEIFVSRSRVNDFMTWLEGK